MLIYTNKKFKFTFALLITFQLLCASQESFAQSAAAGMAKYSSCVSCHGAKGMGGVGPKLAGQSLQAITDKLTKYKNKEKIGPQSQMMWSVAGGLSKTDIDNIATYITTIK